MKTGYLGRLSVLNEVSDVCEFQIYQLFCHKAQSNREHPGPVGGTAQGQFLYHRADELSACHGQDGCCWPHREGHWLMVIAQTAAQHSRN